MVSLVVLYFTFILALFCTITFFWYFIVILRVYNHFCNSKLPISCHNCVIILPIFWRKNNRYILQIFYLYFTIILPIYYHYFTCIVKSFHHYFTFIAPLFSKIIGFCKEFAISLTKCPTTMCHGSWGIASRGA